MLVVFLILVSAPLLNIEPDRLPAIPQPTIRSGPLLTRSSLRFSEHPSVTPSSVSTPSFSTSSLVASMSPHPSKQLSLLAPHLTADFLDELRDFWYEHLTSDDDMILPKPEQNRRWFFGGKELDDICIQRFSPALEAILASGATTAHDILSVAQPRRPVDWLSLVILLDQIPRNCYRGHQAAVVFRSFDPIALQVAVAALEKGIPDTTPETRWRFACRNWFYVPLMHSEDALFHDMAVKGYALMQRDIQELANEPDDVAAEKDEFRQRAKVLIKRDPQAAKAYGELNMSFEKKHQDIILKFGRYPHRNMALGREATPEEIEYLDNGGETFAAKE